MSNQEPPQDRALRYNEGKPQWSLVDFDALEGLVRVLEAGLDEYPKDNWKKGMPTLEICESILRHTFAYMRGEDIDPKSGEWHSDHIQSNAMFLSYMMKYRPEFDNRRIDKAKELRG
jgi:hypothetical protein